MAFLWKVLTLVAVLIMPFGMSGAHASPATHTPTAEMPMGHCSDQPAKHGNDGAGISECTMACAGALPAITPIAQDPVLLAEGADAPAMVQALHGLHPEIATPPPKRA